jgi:VWFA-related protein
MTVKQMHAQWRPQKFLLAALGLTLAVVALGTVAVWQRNIRHKNTDPSDELGSTDFEVRSADGHVVTDVRPDECEIYEDGLRREVMGLVRVHGRRQSTDAKDPERAVASSAQTNLSVAGDRIVLVVIDDLTVRAASVPDVTKILKELRRELIVPGTAVGVVSTGPAALISDLSYDVGKFDKIIDDVEAGALQKPPLHTSDSAAISLNTVRDVISSVGRLRNRRKALILISEGFAADPELAQVFTPIASRGGVPSLPTPAVGPKEADSSVTSLVINAAGIANRAGVVILGIQPDAGSVNRGTTTLVDGPQSVPTLTTTRALAVLTGGTYAVGAKDLGATIEAAAVALGDYYVCSYRSANDAGARALRKIEIKVKRAGVTVKGRAWFVS